MPGPGKISLYAKTPSRIQALLYNFDVNSPDLKPEHIDWMKDNVTQYIARREMASSVIGLASRTGDNAYNVRLSKARAHAVSQQLFLLHPKMPTETMIYVGEEAAALIGVKDGVEDEKWRSVLFTVFEDKLPAPPPSPAKFIDRRVYVKILLKDEHKTFTGGEPGEKGYQLSRPSGGDRDGRPARWWRNSSPWMRLSRWSR